MPRERDVVRFVKSGHTVSGKIMRTNVKGVDKFGRTIIEILLLKDRVYHAYDVLEEDVEVIAYGKT